MQLEELLLSHTTKSHQNYDFERDATLIIVLEDMKTSCSIYSDQIWPWVDGVAQ